MTTAERYAVVSRLPPDLPLALMDMALGVVYIISDPLRTSSAAFRSARSLMPIWAWGVYFLVVGVGLLWMVVCQWVHRRPARRQSVWLLRVLASALFAMWGIMFAISAVVDQHAAVGGIPVYLYLAYRHSFAPAGR